MKLEHYVKLFHSDQKEKKYITKKSFTSLCEIKKQYFDIKHFNNKRGGVFKLAALF